MMVHSQKDTKGCLVLSEAQWRIHGDLLYERWVLILSHTTGTFYKMKAANKPQSITGPVAFCIITCAKHWNYNIKMKTAASKGSYEKGRKKPRALHAILWGKNMS
jgi:hypothetical protein